MEEEMNDSNWLPKEYGDGKETPSTKLDVKSFNLSSKIHDCSCEILRGVYENQINKQDVKEFIRLLKKRVVERCGKFAQAELCFEILEEIDRLLGEELI